MNGRRSAANSTKAAKPAGRLSKAEVHAASPYGYAYADWLAREDPEYMRARAPLSSSRSARARSSRSSIARW